MFKKQTYYDIFAFHDLVDFAPTAFPILYNSSTFFQKLSYQLNSNLKHMATVRGKSV